MRTAIASFFFGKVLFMKHPNVHRLCVFMIIPILVMLVILLILGKFFVVKESFVYLFQEQPIKK